MPPAVAAVAAVAAKTAFTIGTVAVTYGAIAKAALVVGSIAYSSAQARKLRKSMRGTGAAQLDQGRTTMLRDPLAPRRLIYGEAEVSGVITFWHQGADGYHYMVVTMAGHECEALGAIKFDGETVPLDGSGNATGTYAGHVQIRKYLGAAAGHRDTAWESEIPTKWTEHHLGKNVARLHVRLKWNSDLFPGGIPQVTCLVKGKKVYDPRTTTTVWSANAALCLADFLQDEVFGFGVAAGRIKTAALIEAANICDENVTLNPSGTEKRYTVNGSAVTTQGPPDVLADLVGAMAGYAVDTAGDWTIRAGAWRAPSVTFTDGDLVGPFSCVPRQSRSETFNGVRGTYFSPENDWAPADFPAIKNDTYMAWDGGKRLWKDVAYPWTTSPATAQRLAKIDLEAGRQQQVVSANYTLKGVQVQPGDVVNWTRDRLAWTNKAFEVMDWALVLLPSAAEAGGENSAPALGVQMVMKETAEAVFDWNDGEETVVDLAPNTGFYNPRSVAAPTSLTLTSNATTTVVQADGTVVPGIKAAWTAPADPFVVSGGIIRVEFKLDAASDWQEAGTPVGSATEFFIANVTSGASYNVRIRSENPSGVASAWVSGTIAGAGDLVAPAAPGSVVAFAGPGSVILDWADNTEDDLDGYEVSRSAASDFSGAVVIWRGRGSGYADFDVAVSTTMYYRIKAFDRSGNLSVFSSQVSAAANDTTGPQGASGANVATVFIYRRAATSPTLPSATTTFTFATGVLTGLNNGWTQDPPATDGNPLWVSVATASGTGASDTIAAGEWAGAVILVEDGADGTNGANGANGTDGLNVASVFLYQRAASAPSVPGSTTTYTFATGVLSGSLGGWTQTVPTTDGNPLYVTIATAISSGATDDITSGEWAAVAILAQDGADGAGSFVVDSSGASSGVGNNTVYNAISASGTGDGSIKLHTAFFLITCPFSSPEDLTDVAVRIKRGSTTLASGNTGPVIAGGSAASITVTVNAEVPAGSQSFTVEIEGSSMSNSADMNWNGYLKIY
jgi:hypothetical protein